MGLVKFTNENIRICAMSGIYQHGAWVYQHGAWVSQHGAWGVWAWWFGSQSLRQTSGSTLRLLAQFARRLTYLCVIEPKGLQTRVPPDHLRRRHKVQERVNGCSCEVESVDTIFWEHYNLHTLEAKRQRVA